MAAVAESPPSTGSGFVDPAALMRIRSLELRARVVMEGFWKGLHRSPFHGFSVEFSEYRQYVPGDDPRYIDWKVVARSDRVFIKKFEDETNLRCSLMVDHSRSMGYGSGEVEGVTKANYAGTLAATLAYFLLGQGDAVGLTTFDEKIDQHVPARNRPGHLRRLMMQLERAPRGEGTNLIAPLKALVERQRRRGMMVLISDLLAPMEELEAQLGTLGAAGHDLVIFQVLDPAELSFDFEQATHYRDAETGKDLYIDPSAARAGYLKKLNAHQDALKSLCERNRIDYRVLRTDQPLELALFEFVKARKAVSGATQNRNFG